MEGGLIFWFAPICVTIHASPKNIHVFMMVHNFTLVMTGEACPRWWTTGVTGGTHAICAIMVDGEGMAEIGW
jgi:hypothetical protein